MSPLGVVLGCRCQDSRRDRLGLAKAVLVHEQPHDARLLELGGDRLGMLVGELPEVDRRDLVGRAHPISSASRHPRTELTRAIAPASRSSSAITGRSTSRPPRSNTSRYVPASRPEPRGGVTHVPSSRTARLAIVDSVTSPRSFTRSSNAGRAAESTFALARISAYSPAAEEPCVIPPPTPYSAAPV